MENKAWSFAYDQIKSQYKQTIEIIQTALSLEDNNHKSQALEDYKKAIQLIDSTLLIKVAYPENPDETWEEAIAIIQELKKLRGDLLSRINQIIPAEDTVDQPPSYEEATQTTPKTYKELADALHKIEINPDVSAHFEPEVIFMYGGVKLYFISGEEEVSSSLEPQTLKIILVEDEVHRAILEIGDFVYPLIPGVSPCFRSDFGAFILPDVTNETEGACIGIILPPDAEPSAYETLESILHGIVQNSSVEKPSSSNKISNGILSGANYLSETLKSGAGKMSNYMNNKTPNLMNKIKSNEKETKIPTKVNRGVEIAESTSHKVAEVTGKLSKKVGVATVKLARYLAPHIEKGGTRVLTTFRMDEEKASAKVKGAMSVAASAVEGFSTVYCGLEHSAFILGKSLKDNTVKVVEHKYGQSAGNLTSGSLNTVGNVFHVSHNIKIFQPHHFTKYATKAAGKIMIYERNNKDKNT